MLALLAPLVAVGALSSADIGEWLRTGLCPGGPMDRPVQPCGPMDLFFIVFLGGWGAFLVVPLLVVWSVFWVGAFVAVRGFIHGRPAAQASISSDG